MQPQRADNVFALMITVLQPGLELLELELIEAHFAM